MVRRRDGVTGTRHPARSVPSELLFDALDGRELRVGGTGWRVEIYSVVDDADRRWVQLALEGATHQLMTLALADTQGPRQAVRTLSSWLRNPSTEAGHVLLHVT